MSERPRLEGKVAIVTGAGSSGPGVGNGKATSLLFAREGARVLLVDATLERAEETQRMIQEEGGEASVFQGDMTSRDDCQAMADAAMERQLLTQHSVLGLFAYALISPICLKPSYVQSYVPLHLARLRSCFQWSQPNRN